ncbi:unnamed protein product [Blepharisma stoltei]|uniref:Maturase K n=1 Tax=Blepharisma stoltei TaxID=1481888 RepID=A0AAU9JWY7_9CILI|nr:unnamed protein product [Blepharisma stoltei]
MNPFIHNKWAYFGSVQAADSLLNYYITKQFERLFFIAIISRIISLPSINANWRDNGSLLWLVSKTSSRIHLWARGSPRQATKSRQQMLSDPLLKPYNISSH